MGCTDEKQIIQGQKINDEFLFQKPAILMNANDNKGNRTGRWSGTVTSQPFKQDLTT